jgi:hypothetical protein
MQDRAVISVVRRVAHAYGGLSLTVKVLVVVGLAVGTTAIGVAVVVWLPADHFSRLPDPTAGWRRHRVLRWTALLLKNLLGLVLLPLGIFMALPLVPGPGLVFILVGLSLLDFPGKRSLERRLLRLPAVHHFLNRVRHHFKRPPLVVDFQDEHPLPSRGRVRP